VQADSPSLDVQTSDYVASAVRSLVGTVPFAGSLLTEIASTIIPNQRMDRVVKFAAELETRLSGLEQDFVRSQLTNENFAELMEEGLRQAARSLSDERRAHIATLIAKSLDPAGIGYAESRHLLRVLGEINDVEIIRLASQQFETYGSGQAYREKHRVVLEPVMPSIASDQEERDKATLQNSYDVHLQQLGLLNPRYNVDRKTKQLQVGHDGDLEVRGYSLSSFGWMLLRQLDIIVPGEERERGALLMPERRRQTGAGITRAATALSTTVLFPTKLPSTEFTCSDRPNRTALQLLFHG
jgi:hypothetical protein